MPRQNRRDQVSSAVIYVSTSSFTSVAGRTNNLPLIVPQTLIGKHRYMRRLIFTSLRNLSKRVHNVLWLCYSSLIHLCIASSTFSLQGFTFCSRTITTELLGAPLVTHLFCFLFSVVPRQFYLPIDEGLTFDFIFDRIKRPLKKCIKPDYALHISPDYLCLLNIHISCLMYLSVRLELCVKSVSLCFIRRRI